MLYNKKFSKVTLNKLGDRTFWMTLNPSLTISDRPFLFTKSLLNTDYKQQSQHLKQMREQGYFKLDSVFSRDKVTLLARGIEKLVSEGFPPIFISVYDEFWQFFKEASPFVSPIFGDDYRMVTNIWAWYIPPNDSEAGFEPHRDIAGAPNTEKGYPWLATVWIPLTDVTTHHACMHVLPANVDPKLPGDPMSTNIPAENIQDIRALPAKAGSILSWHPNVLHWGSKSSKWVKTPRISIATYLMRADGGPSNYPNISLDSDGIMTLDFRLGIIGMSVEHFDKDAIAKERYPTELIEFCRNYLYCERNETRNPNDNRPRDTPSITTQKIGRNDHCPCGSGKKYKKCHGQLY